MIGTRFNLIDLSETTENVEVVTTDNAPLVLACGPTAKGTEAMTVISGEDYRSMYGAPDFKKYGQGSVQNQIMIDQGAKLLFKRVVASDATLANVTLMADIKVVPELKNQYNADGTPVYETEEVEAQVDESIAVVEHITASTDGYTTYFDANYDTFKSNIEANLTTLQPGATKAVITATSTTEVGVNSEYKVEYIKTTTKTVTQYKTVTVGNKTVKVISQAWTPSAELGYIAATDGDVKHLNVRTATDNLADKYKAEKGVVPTDDADVTALVDETHSIIEPDSSYFESGVEEKLAKLWGYTFDEIVDGEYNGYWVVDNSWLKDIGDGKKVINIPVDATAEQAHAAIEMHFRYPLFTVADIGRGVSAKSFTITPENDISKNLSFMYYTLAIIEDGNTIESIRFSMLPDVIYRNECVDMEMAARNNLKYSQCVPYEDNINAFVEKLADTMGEDVETLQQNDFLFGTLRKGTALAGITSSTTFTADMKTEGITLESGDNGSFTDSPMTNAEDLVYEKILAFYSDGANEKYDNAAPKTDSGEYLYKTRLQDSDTTDDIYDLDTYQIDAMFDSNLPAPIKGAIGALVNYRADFFYFRDHGLGIRTFADAEAAVSGELYNTIQEGYECDVQGKEKPGEAGYEDHVNGTITASIHKDLNGNGVLDNGLVTYGTDYSSDIIQSTWISDWVQSYDVINPYDLKQINVTITYDLARYMINHILNHVNAPFAGERNGAVITDIIDNTLSYKPRVLPSVNEKDELEDIKCNFASYYKEKFTVESLYTSQVRNTQLSFINNAMAVQRVIKALRVKFPSIRYQFITDTSDLEAYTTEINEFLSLYSGMFAELRFEYVQDKVAAANKIYTAALYFKFNNFAQGEKIDAYMLPTEVL